jgi:hypothetical protein
METSEGRITGENMRVAIVSTPRTCSSFLGNIFAKKFDLIDYSEMFSGNWLQASPELKLKIVNRSDNYTMKVTSTSLTTYTHLFTTKNFPWEKFDYIVLAERLDIAQQVSSWMLLSHAQQTGRGEQSLLVEYLREGMKNPDELPVDVGQIENIVRTINHFHDEVKSHLLNSGLKSVKLVNHEMFQKPREEYIEELREKTDIYWRLDDIHNEGNPTYVDYTPYIEAKNIRQLIDDIQLKIKNPNATKEENNEPIATKQPAENEGSV